MTAAFYIIAAAVGFIAGVAAGLHIAGIR